MINKKLLNFVSVAFLLLLIDIISTVVPFSFFLSQVQSLVAVLLATSFFH